jgi:hypothetical protein
VISYRNTMSLLPEILIECDITQDEIAHGIGTALCEIPKIVLIIPIDDPLRQSEFGIALRDRSTQETAGALILQKIGNAFAEATPSERLRRRIEVILVSRKSTQGAQRVDVSMLIDLPQWPLLADAFDFPEQRVSRATRCAETENNAL